MHLNRALSIAALMCLVGAPAFAQVNYPDFSSTAGLTLNGASAAVNNGIDPAPVLRLARANVLFDGGTTFRTQRVCLARFSSFFEFRITNPGGLPDASGQSGADGLTLTLQGVGPNAVGIVGGSLAYGGIAPSVAVEFDTWDNGIIDAGTNHVGIDVNGNLNSAAKVAVPGRFDDGAKWSVWVDYDGTTLEVRVSNIGARPALPTLSLPINIPATLGSTAGFAGFTAATGAAWGNHDIASWTYDGTCSNIIVAGCDTSVVDFFTPGGALLSEGIRACVIQSTTHGAVDSCVAALTNAAMKDGFITGRQKGAIQSCVARSPFYTGPVKTGEFIANGSFETGDATGWTLSASGGAWAINGGTFDPFGPAVPLPPIGGAFDLVSHQGGGNLNRAMQTLMVPLEVREAKLTWSDRVQSFAALVDPSQEYRVMIRSALTLAPIVELFSTNAGDLAVQVGPNLRSLDLTATLQALKGQQVVLSFEEQATFNYFTLTLDNVSLVMKYR